MLNAAPCFEICVENLQVQCTSLDFQFSFANNALTSAILSKLPKKSESSSIQVQTFSSLHLESDIQVQTKCPSKVVDCVGICETGENNFYKNNFVETCYNKFI